MTEFLETIFMKDNIFEQITILKYYLLIFKIIDSKALGNVLNEKQATI